MKVFKSHEHSPYYLAFKRTDIQVIVGGYANRGYELVTDLIIDEDR